MATFSQPVWLFAIDVLLVSRTFPAPSIEYSSKKAWVIPPFTSQFLIANAELPHPVRKGQRNLLLNQSRAIRCSSPSRSSGAETRSWPLWLYVIALMVVGMGGSIMLSHIVNRADWSATLFGKRLRVSSP